MHPPRRGVPLLHVWNHFHAAFCCTHIHQLSTKGLSCPEFRWEKQHAARIEIPGSTIQLRWGSYDHATGASNTGGRWTPGRWTLCRDIAGKGQGPSADISRQRSVAQHHCYSSTVYSCTLHRLWSTVPTTSQFSVSLGETQVSLLACMNYTPLWCGRRPLSLHYTVRPSPPEDAV